MPKGLKPILRQDGEPRQPLGRNVSEDLKAGNSAEFSKPQIPLPDRGFESVPLRQLVGCFSREISLSGIIAEYPGLRLGKVGVSNRRERILENGGAV
jgi:hypothetical protein